MAAAAAERFAGIGTDAARHHRSARARTLGLTVVALNNPFFADLAASVAECATEHGLALQVGDSANDPDREADHLQRLASLRVGGVLHAPVGEVGEPVLQLRRRGIPVVLVDRTGSDPDFCSVAVDDVEGGRLAVAHLTERGHRRIAFVGGPGSLHQVRDRLLGAKVAVAGAEHDVRLRTVLTSGLDVGSGLKAATTLAGLAPPERPTAVFAANDLLALGLLAGLAAAGLAVPGDVALVGYDDIDLAAGAAVALSSVRQPWAALGRRATELLLTEMGASEPVVGGDHQHEHVRFIPELVVRASSADAVVAAGQHT